MIQSARPIVPLRWGRKHHIGGRAMRKPCLLVAVMIALLGTWAVQADNDKSGGNTPPKVEKARPEELIKQLGSSKFAERERARKALEGIGLPALDALRQAAKEGDLETSRRAAEIVRKLEDKLLTEAMLTPKRLRLKLQDRPVLEAVAELSKQSGYNIQIMGDRTLLADRKITIDTGETTFWEALDLLCEKAGLMETQLVPTPARKGDVPGKIRMRKGGALPLLPPPPPAPAPGILPVVPPNAPAPAPNLQAAPAMKLAAPLLAQVAAQPAQVQQVQVQQIQVQVQAQPAQVQPAQVKQLIQRVDDLIDVNGRPSVPDGQIHLTPGKAPEVRTSYAGAVRVRIRPATGGKNDEINLVLDVAAEPRLQNFQIIGTPRIDKAVDDEGQTLKAVAAEPAQPKPDMNGVMRNRIFINGQTQAPQRQTIIRLKRGDKDAKSLKELSGTITAQALMPTEALAKVENVLKAAGQTAKVKDGGTMQVHSVDKMPNGDYQIKVTLENLPGMNGFGGNGVIQIQGGGVIIQGNGVVIRRMQIGGGNVAIAGGFPGSNQEHAPKLLDAKGKAYQLVTVNNQEFQINNGQTTITMTAVYRPQAGQGDPAELVYYGQRMVNFPVTFSFRDLPLP